MPARAENTNVFDLKLLKALLNFKINKNHLRELAAEDKRMLCKSYNKGGVLTLSPAYLVKMWPKGKEISSNITLSSLNQLCGILRQNYRWYDFINDISRFRPYDIPKNKVYSYLSEGQKEKIDKVIEDIFHQYKTFEEFEKVVIDKSESSNIPNGHIEAIASFLHRIYVELSTRKAGIPINEDNDVIEEIYDSWYKLFCNIRDEMKLLPAAYFRNSHSYPAIQMAHEILNEILRPHLTEHQAKFRRWFENARQNQKNKNIAPQQLQKNYPDYKVLMMSIKEVNKKLVDVAKELYDSGK